MRAGSARKAAKLQSIPAASWSESEFQAHVVELARGLGWGISYNAWKAQAAELNQFAQPAPPLDGVLFHPRIMYRSDPGWPDLTLVRRRDRRLIFAELKREDGELSTRQRKVLELLLALEFDPMEWPSDVAARAPRIQVFIWRPSQLDAIAAVLQ